MKKFLALSLSDVVYIKLMLKCQQLLAFLRFRAAELSIKIFFIASETKHDYSPVNQKQSSIECMWAKFKAAVTSAMDKYVPAKIYI